jgi:hypothetical protein
MCARRDRRRAPEIPLKRDHVHCERQESNPDPSVAAAAGSLRRLAMTSLHARRPVGNWKKTKLRAYSRRHPRARPAGPWMAGTSLDEPGHDERVGAAGGEPTKKQLYSPYPSSGRPMTAPRRASWGTAACLALGLALALCACGKKGAPQPPPGVPNTYPQPYPRA